MRALLVKLIGQQEDLKICGAWGSGEEALSALDALRPDVVVVDLELPGISGEECIRDSIREPAMRGFRRADRA